MSVDSDPVGSRITRRSFMLGAGTGLAVGLPAAWLALKNSQNQIIEHQHWSSPAHQEEPAKYGMPGPFPGRVVEIRHPDSVRADSSINSAAVKTMIDRGMCELTGAEHALEAWQAF